LRLEKNQIPAKTTEQDIVTQMKVSTGVSDIAVYIPMRTQERMNPILRLGLFFIFYPINDSRIWHFLLRCEPQVLFHTTHDESGNHLP
jgi:hypothetical protein